MPTKRPKQSKRVPRRYVRQYGKDGYFGIGEGPDYLPYKKRVRKSPQ